MSCSYADGLSDYDDKGVLGVPEKFDEDESVNTKCAQLAEWISQARYVVVHTGAGISTSAGIPDFRGPNGVWTMQEKGLKPTINISFDAAIPTKTHMALKKLSEVGYVKYIVSQNIDGLHLKSGLERKFLSELHGNMFVEQCDTCDRQFIRQSATTSVGEKCLEKNCLRARLTGRACRGKLCDTILDWEANLPELDLKLGELHSSIADLNICLGTTLQIVPSGNLPLRGKKFGGKLAIINLQPTKHNKKADLIINTYVDVVLEKVMKRLGLEIPEYTAEVDPSRNKDLQADKKVLDWSIYKTDLLPIKELFTYHCKDIKKRKIMETKVVKKAKTEVDKKVKAVSGEKTDMDTTRLDEVKTDTISDADVEANDNVATENSEEKVEKDTTREGNVKKHTLREDEVETDPIREDKGKTGTTSEKVVAI